MTELEELKRLADEAELEYCEAIVKFTGCQRALEHLRRSADNAFLTACSARATYLRGVSPKDSSEKKEEI